MTDSPDGRGALWRMRERDWLDREPTAFAQRLTRPIAIAASIDFLRTLTEDPNSEMARTAGEILRDVQPLVEGEIADFIRGEDPWRDTFALWQLTRRPKALELLRELALAIAMPTGRSRAASRACRPGRAGRSKPCRWSRPAPTSGSGCGPLAIGPPSCRG